MMSLGQKMYERFARLNAELTNCEVDSWNELDQSDRDVWENLALEYEA